MNTTFQPFTVQISSARQTSYAKVLSFLIMAPIEVDSLEDFDKVVHNLLPRLRTSTYLHAE